MYGELSEERIVYITMYSPELSVATGSNDSIIRYGEAVVTCGPDSPVLGHIPETVIGVFTFESTSMLPVMVKFVPL